MPHNIEKSAGSFKGLAELREACDLVKKLEYDLERILNSPQDQYAAFDFFVTAEHIVDWIYPNNRKAREEMRASSPLLRITSQLANGVKHFEAKALHHKSVTGVEKERYVGAGYVEDGYFEDPLIVYLAEKQQNDLGYSNIDVAVLARQVYEFWKSEVP